MFTKESESEVTQLCSTLCNPTDCSLPGSSIHEIFSRQEYWSGLPFPSPGDRPSPEIEPGSPELKADTLLSEPIWLFIVYYNHRNKFEYTQGFPLYTGNFKYLVNGSNIRFFVFWCFPVCPFHFFGAPIGWLDLFSTLFIYGLQSDVFKMIANVSFKKVFWLI